jgi:hypothetical protein
MSLRRCDEGDGSLVGMGFQANGQFRLDRLADIDPGGA